MGFSSGGSAGGGGVPSIPYNVRKGSWFGLPHFAAAVVNTASAVGTLHFVPMYAPEPMVIDRMSYDHGTADAGASIHMGIYAGGDLNAPMNQEGLMVGELLVDAGISALAFGNSNYDKAIADLEVPEGWFWLAGLHLNAATSFRRYGGTDTIAWLGSDMPQLANNFSGLFLINAPHVELPPGPFAAGDMGKVTNPFKLSARRKLVS